MRARGAGTLGAIVRTSGAVRIQWRRDWLWSLAVIVVALVLAIPSSSVAGVVLISADRDNTIYEQYDENSNGAGDYIYAAALPHPGGSFARRGLIQFDIASYVPAGMTIDTARLALHLSYADPSSYDVTHQLHRVTAEWGEGTTDPADESTGAAAVTGDATWHYRFFSTDPWVSSGGDYIPSASASQTVGDEGYYTWASETMDADVQSWLDDPASNFGWILIADEDWPGHEKRFDSRTNPTVSHRPELWVYYTPTSPGIAVCNDPPSHPGTAHDVQTIDDGQRAIATFGGSEAMHFVWTDADRIPASFNALDRMVSYTGLVETIPGQCLNNCGVVLADIGDPAVAHAGFASVDIGSLPGLAGPLVHVALSQRTEDTQLQNPDGPLTPFVYDQGVACMGIWPNNPTSLPEATIVDAQWPHIAIDRTGDQDTDVYHVTARPTGEVAPFNDEILYWRRIGEPPWTWEGPVVLDINAGHYNHHVAVDPTSAKVSVIYTQDQTPGNPNNLLQIVYMESATNGTDWLTDGVSIYPTPLITLPQYGFVQATSYANPSGPVAWRECTGEYDLDGKLHVVWVEQAVAGGGGGCRLQHWDDVTLTASTVVEGLGFLNTGSHGVYDLWLASPNIAIGDGSTVCTDNPNDNRNYLYVSYEQYGGPTVEEGNDVSAGGHQNLEFYLTASSDGGHSWIDPVNLTNTKTPGCIPPDCQSERDPSLALTVDDTLHIMYILDTDAGDAVFGQGTWTFSPVMYYPIPGGTDHPWFCPPVPSCSCPYQSDFDEDGFLTALDLGEMIDILFAGHPDVSDPLCPSPRADFDCDGFSTALDLSGLIDHLFAGADGPCDPCTP